jgi:hypothetical protein
LKEFSEVHASSIASEADRSRWASAWARRSLAFCSTVTIASAPAANRSRDAYFDRALELIEERLLRPL